MYSKYKGILILLITLDLSVSPRVLANAKLYGGTLVIGESHRPTIINPVLTDGSVSAGIMTLIMNRLVQYDSSGDIQPDIAKSWDISDDGRIYTFHLRRGIKFHDGVELTAEDVLYTYGQVMDHANLSPFFKNFELVEKMEAVDPYTFRVFIRKPSVTFIYAMVREIAPKHLYENEPLQSGSFNWHPVGTGPFLLKEWGPDNQITLDANPGYFAGRPLLDHIIYKNYQTKSEVWSALLRGEVDLAEFLSVDDYELTRQDPSFKTYATMTTDYYLISYNLADPLMSDKRVRQAIAHAVDRQGMIRAVERGYGMEATGPFRKESWAFDPKVRAISHDPPAAIRLLKEAGWKDRDGDGFLDKAGSRLTIRMLVHSRDEKLKKISMFIRQNLQEVGIQLSVRLYNDVGKIKPETLQKEYQAMLTFFPGPDFDPNETIKFWYSSDSRARKVWTRSESNAEIDQLIRLASVTSDKTERRQIYRRIHRLIYDEQPACFLYFPFVFHAVSKKIGGTDPFLGSAFMPDHLIKDLYVTNVKPTAKGGDA